MKPRLFVGSTVERLDIARAVQQELDDDFVVSLWSQHMFEPGDTTWTRLIEIAQREFDYALFVFGADDPAMERDTEVKLVRDNVLLEYGLFVGVLGPKRTFFLYDRSKKPKIASDLAGVTALTFDGTTSNLQAAVGSACSSIRTIARRFGIRHEPVSRGYKPLDELVPPDARLVALVGQNLASRLGFLDDERARFREQLHNVLALKTLERLYLVLLSPDILKSLHPEAWQHLRDITVPAIRAIHAELPGLLTSKIRVCVHRAATLSLLAIDWDDADRKRILVMPKLQRPRRPMALGDRIVVSLAHELCDIDELRWMIYDAEQQKDGARSAKLADAERMLLDELASP